MILEDYDYIDEPSDDEKNSMSYAFFITAIVIFVIITVSIIVLFMHRSRVTVPVETDEIYNHFEINYPNNPKTNDTEEYTEFLITEKLNESIINLITDFIISAGTFGPNWADIHRMTHAMQWKNFPTTVRNNNLTENSRVNNYLEIFRFIYANGPTSISQSQARQLSDWHEENAFANYQVIFENIEIKNVYGLVWNNSRKIIADVNFTSTMNFINMSDIHFTVINLLELDHLVNEETGFFAEQVLSFAEDLNISNSEIELAYSQIRIEEIIFNREFTENLQITLIEINDNWLIYEITNQTYPFLLSTWDTVNASNFVSRFDTDSMREGNAR